MASISKLIGVRSVLLLLLISITFLNWHGYWYVFAVLPIMYALLYYEVFRACDKVTVLLFLFGVAYSVFTFELPFNTYASFMFIYPMLYLVGKYIGLSEDGNSLMKILFVVAFSMAAMYLLSISIDIAKYGFYSETRNIEIEGRGSSEEISATGIYSHLMLLTTFIAALFTRIPWRSKLIYVICAILAFVVSIRIQSRTSVVIMMMVVALSLFVNFRTIIKRHSALAIILLGFLFFAANYALINYEEELGILERFQDEDVGTGGYRTELSMAVLNKLSESPWGGLENMPYAHNMWLDCARVAGIVPLFILLLITMFYIRGLWHIYKLRLSIDGNGCDEIIVIMGIALLVYMNVEPILEGSPLLFGFFTILLGMIRGRTNMILGLS